MGAAQRGEELHDEERPDRSDPQRADHGAAARLEEVHGLRLELEDAARDREKRVAGLGQGDLAGKAVKELDAVMLLERADLGRDRRLADVERACGAGEAQMLGDRVERPELVEVEILEPSGLSLAHRPILDARLPALPPPSL